MDETLRLIVAEQYQITILAVDTLGRKSLKITTNKGIFAAKKINKSPIALDQLQHQLAVFDYLSVQNFPAISLYKTVSGQSYVESETDYLFLYQYLQGTHPASSQQFFQELGQFLATLHRLPINSYKFRSEFHTAKQLPRIINRLTSYQGTVNQGEAQAVISKLEVGRSSAGAPLVFIHSDPYYFNLVRDQAKMLHFIDLDHAGLAPAVVDLGFVLAYMCFMSPELGKDIYWQVEGAGDIWQPSRSLQMTKVFLQSYQQIRPLSEIEWDLLPQAVKIASVRYIQSPEDGSFNRQYYRRLLLLDQKVDMVLKQVSRVQVKEQVVDSYEVDF